MYIYIHIHTYIHTHTKLLRKRIGFWVSVYKLNIICTNYPFLLKGTWGVYRFRSYLVDFLVSGWDSIFLLYSLQSVNFVFSWGNLW